MPRTIYDSTKGIYSTRGSGFTIQSTIGIQSNSFFGGCTPDAAPDTNNSDASNISVADYRTNLSTGGSQTRTLPDGTSVGQQKQLFMAVDGGGNLDITLSSPISAALDIIRMTNIGDTADLIWTGSAWRILALYNSAGGNITTPTVS